MPIRIVADGPVILDGGRGPLPYMGEVGYTYSSDNIPLVINEDYIEFDGAGFGSWLVRHFREPAMEIAHSTVGLRVRSMDITECGWANEYEGAWYPDGPGIWLSGTDVLFERCRIWDCAQDPTQSDGGINGVTFKHCWLHNARAHPTLAGAKFNYGNHSDGVQVYSGGEQSGLTLENCIVGPALMQGLLLGDHAHAGAVATMHDVILKNCLLLGYQGENVEFTSLLTTKYDPAAEHPNAAPTGYVLENCTFVAAPGAQWWNVNLLGTGHEAKNCIFYGGYGFRGGDDNDEDVTYTNCYYYGLTIPGALSSYATLADPEFISQVPTLGQTDWDYTVHNDDISGAGCSITTLAKFYAEAGA